MLKGLPVITFIQFQHDFGSRENPEDLAGIELLLTALFFFISFS